MYSVIETSGFQHKVTLGEILQVPTLDAEIGSEVVFDKVLLHHDGTNATVGQPLVAGAVVKAKVLGHDKADKIVVFKRKRRKGYRLTRGHRQPFTEVVIVEFAVGGNKVAAAASLVAQAEKRAKAMAEAKKQSPRVTRKEKVAQAAKA